MTWQKKLRIAVALVLWITVATLAWYGVWIPLLVLAGLSLLVVLAFAWPVSWQRKKRS